MARPLAVMAVAAAAGAALTATMLGSRALWWATVSHFGPDHGDPYVIVGLGDSIPAGTAARGPDFLRRLGRAAHHETGRAYRVVNLAIPGLTSRGLDLQLRLPTVARQVQGADLVCVTIGANDFNWPLVKGQTDHKIEPFFASLRVNLETVLRRVLDLRAGSGAGVLVTGYWNVSIDGKRAHRLGHRHRKTSDALTRRVNALLAELADEFAMTYVDLYAPFKGAGDLDPTHLLAADGMHPNAHGHSRIAEVVRDAARRVRTRRPRG